MSSRRNQKITAEGLLQDIVAQMSLLDRFVEIDLTPVLVHIDPADRDRALGLISQGASSCAWVKHLYEICRWVSLASAEEGWLQEQGIEGVCQDNRLRGVWSMPSFLRHLGLSNDQNIASDLKQGRKVKRLETKLGLGISLLMVPVMPIFRRLNREEEAKAIELLRADYAGINQCAQRNEWSAQIYRVLVSETRIFPARHLLNSLHRCRPLDLRQRANRLNLHELKYPSLDHVPAHWAKAIALPYKASLGRKLYLHHD